MSGWRVLPPPVIFCRNFMEGRMPMLRNLVPVKVFVSREPAVMETDNVKTGLVFCSMTAISAPGTCAILCRGFVISIWLRTPLATMRLFATVWKPAMAPVVALPEHLRILMITTPAPSTPAMPSAVFFTGHNPPALPAMTTTSAPPPTPAIVPVFALAPILLSAQRPMDVTISVRAIPRREPVPIRKKPPSLHARMGIRVPRRMFATLQGCVPEQVIPAMMEIPVPRMFAMATEVAPIRSTPSLPAMMVIPVPRMPAMAAEAAPTPPMQLPCATTETPARPATVAITQAFAVEPPKSALPWISVTMSGCVIRQREPAPIRKKLSELRARMGLCVQGPIPATPPECAGESLIHATTIIPAPPMPAMEMADAPIQLTPERYAMTGICAQEAIPALPLERVGVFLIPAMMEIPVLRMFVMATEAAPTPPTQVPCAMTGTPAHPLTPAPVPVFAWAAGR